VNDRAAKHVVITNSGAFNFDFDWRSAIVSAAPRVGRTIPRSPGARPSGGKEGAAEATQALALGPHLVITPTSGTVRRGEHVSCRVEFHPTSDMSMEELIYCTVAGKNTYALTVTGQGARPALQFSFFTHNFGPCFVPARGAAPQPEETFLSISNNEQSADVQFDCLFEKKPHLDVTCGPTVLKPGASVRIPIRFTPREVREYREVLEFEVNGMSKARVVVAGEGTLLKLELANPSQAEVSFGSLRVGQEASRAVRVVNRSKRSAAFSLVDKEEAGVGRLEGRNVTFAPRGVVVLAPRESIAVELAFTPTRRIPAFNEDVLFATQGLTQRLLSVTGACLGIEVRLETEALPFGSVVKGCRLTRRIQLENTGDIGTSFKWSASAFGPDFSIVPSEGFLPARGDASLEITFRPTRIFDDFRAEKLVCVIDGAEPVFLTLSGACVPQPAGDIKEVLFAARVRQESKQKVTLANPTQQLWRVAPTIDNEYWWGKSDTVEIPPGSKVEYELTYCPLTMTARAAQPASAEAAESGGAVASMTAAPAFHEGSMFCALPNGQGILYKLKGTASEPEVAGSIKRTTKAKEPIVVLLPVKNWLKQAQRFHATVLRTDAAPIPSHFLRGSDCLDVPAAAARDYKLTFNALTEGESKARVTLTNKETGEFLFYDVAVSATAPGVFGTVALRAPVRQPAQSVITIENPFERHERVTFVEPWWRCDDPCVRVRQLGDMSGRSEGTFEVEYRPLSLPAPAPLAAAAAAAGGDGIVEKTATLTIKSPELGDYIYSLSLGVKPAATERSLHFKTALGGEHLQQFRFRHYVQSGPVKYECRVSQPEFFEVQSVLEVPPAASWDGVEVVVNVKFEPNAMGEVRDVLRVSHPVGGEYLCALQGLCVPPRPQGPIVIAKGGAAEVVFKNVFAATNEFVFTTDTPAFTLSAPRATINAKASATVKVTYAAAGAGGAPTMGKLFISCPKLAELPPWIYYLSV
jgi:hydrocephalus-inducing protein